MSPIPRIVSVSLAWAAAIGLMVPIGLAPPAMAAPCSGDAANAPPPPSAIVTDPGPRRSARYDLDTVRYRPDASLAVPTTVHRYPSWVH